ncbi:hypothetical protein PNOK_0928200 [Pyrrhoderma noxium]|uniref:Uncharacterized protein n=1 Tax=Pyrrhoderma noxium TaxID=2282107 RepID=A0A286U7G5_9AGAM|nr:hypothetical protein PNOK_0928200 [Pyrrhoderma noxium]
MLSTVESIIQSLISQSGKIDLRELYQVFLNTLILSTMGKRSISGSDEISLSRITIINATTLTMISIGVPTSEYPMTGIIITSTFREDMPMSF